jgi:hypothetical protein
MILAVLILPEKIPLHKVGAISVGDVFVVKLLIGAPLLQHSVGHAPVQPC